MFRQAFLTWPASFSGSMAASEVDTIVTVDRSNDEKINEEIDDTEIKEEIDDTPPVVSVEC